MRTKLIIAMLLIASATWAQFNPSYDTVKFKRGGKIWQLINYGTDSVKINGVMFRAGGLWKTVGAFIQPDPTKAIKYPGIPTTIGATVPGSYRTTYFDKTTKALLMFEPTGGGGILTEGQSVTGCEAVYTYETENLNATIFIDSIKNICGEILIKNQTQSSIVILNSIEGKQIDGKSTIYIPQQRWVSIKADSNRFITTGTNTTNEITVVNHAATPMTTLSIDDNSIVWEGYSDGNQDTLQMPSPSARIGMKYVVVKSGYDSAVVLAGFDSYIYCAAGAVQATTVSLKEGHNYNLEFMSDGSDWYLIREEDYIAPLPP